MSKANTAQHSVLWVSILQCPGARGLTGGGGGAIPPAQNISPAGDLIVGDREHCDFCLGLSHSWQEGSVS